MLIKKSFEKRFLKNTYRILILPLLIDLALHDPTCKGYWRRVWSFDFALSNELPRYAWMHKANCFWLLQFVILASNRVRNENPRMESDARSFIVSGRTWSTQLHTALYKLKWGTSKVIKLCIGVAFLVMLLTCILLLLLLYLLLVFWFLALFSMIQGVLSLSHFGRWPGSVWLTIIMNSPLLDEVDDRLTIAPISKIQNNNKALYGYVNKKGIYSSVIQRFSSIAGLADDTDRNYWRFNKIL